MKSITLSIVCLTSLFLIGCSSPRHSSNANPTTGVAHYSYDPEKNVTRIEKDGFTWFAAGNVTNSIPQGIAPATAR